MAVTKSDLDHNVRKIPIYFLMSVWKMGWACDHVLAEMLQILNNLNNRGQVLTLTARGSTLVVRIWRLWTSDSDD